MVLIRKRILIAIIAFLSTMAILIFTMIYTPHEDDYSANPIKPRGLIGGISIQKGEIKEQLKHQMIMKEIKIAEQAETKEFERIEQERQEAERAEMKVWALELEEKERQKRAKEEAQAASGGNKSGGGVLTKSKGVNYFNGRKETYYSSKVLYHYRTGEWTAGSDGVYRDSAGYVVVAASDLAQGVIVGTSLGTGKVYDSGCAAGITDIYVNW